MNNLSKTMYEPKRYDPQCENCGACKMDEWSMGSYVSYSDYEKLMAENERIRKLFADTERLMLIEGEYEASKAGTIASLQAKITQLLEAGDSLAETMEREGFYRCAYKWHIATEDIR